MHTIFFTIVEVMIMSGKTLLSMGSTATLPVISEFFHQLQLAIYIK
jgi:hypothetical protein